MKFIIHISGVALLCLIQAAPVLGQTLLLNGDFENPPESAGTFLSVGATIPGWTVVGVGTVHHVFQPTVFWPGNPSQFMDLTGGTGNAGVRSDPFNTTSGQIYDVTFDSLNGSVISSTPVSGYTGPALTVQASGGPLTQYGNLPLSVPQVLTYTFTASSSLTTLTFMDMSGFDSNAGWIDNVRIQPVPEPVGLSLMAGAAGLWMLRRKPGVRVED